MGRDEKSDGRVSEEDEEDAVKVECRGGRVRRRAVE